MAELLATLEAPAYVERVALADAKNIMKARRAIRKALEIQRDGGGFTFIEILSPCPTLWGKDPVEARKWVAETMIPAFPVGVFRDRKPVESFLAPPPRRSVPEVLEIQAGEVETPAAEETSKHSRPFRPMTIEIAGFGGQGVLLLGQLLAEMGVREGLEVSWLPSYGPEMRSGTANCQVRLSASRIGSPLVSHPDVLIAMNEISLRKFAPSVPPEGLIVYNQEKLPADFEPPAAKTICIPGSEIADQLGSARAANIVLLGAVLEETGCLDAESAVCVIKEKVKKAPLLETDLKALEAGRQRIDKQMSVLAENQADGFAY